MDRQPLVLVQFHVDQLKAPLAIRTKLAAQDTAAWRNPASRIAEVEIVRERGEKHFKEALQVSYRVVKTADDLPWP